jgi:uncharacterized RDD family membrane protein YckC
MNEEILRFLDREQLSLASKQKRLLAYALDELILSVIWLGVIWDSFTGLGSIEDKIALINTYILEFMLLKVIYHTFFVMQYAASPGKIIMKIRVLELGSNTTPSFLCSLNRATVRVVSEMFFYAGFVWGLLDPVRQTWHDKTARTVIVDA